MPYKPLQVCNRSGCLRFTSETYCAEHKAQHEAEQRARRAEYDKRHDAKRESRSKRGYTGKWYEYRKGFLARHPWCADCTKRGDEHVPATDVDHIIPHKGNTALFWDTNNHQALCHSCHSRKTARENLGGARV